MNPAAGCVFVDGTFGGGGHARALQATAEPDEGSEVVRIPAFAIGGHQEHHPQEHRPGRPGMFLPTAMVHARPFYPCVHL